jgi:hypothetical protein
VPAKDVSAVEEIAYEDAVRALTEQRGLIESLRTRAGLLLSAAAITTSFLGSQALAGGGSSAFAWSALGGFSAASMFCLAVLWPRSWEFTARPTKPITTQLEVAEPFSPSRLHRDLTLQMHDEFAENKRGIGHLASLLGLASASLAIDVILWLVTIATA